MKNLRSIFFIIILLAVGFRIVTYQKQLREKSRTTHSTLSNLKGWSIYLINERYQIDMASNDFSHLPPNQLPSSHNFEHVGEPVDSIDACYSVGKKALEELNRGEKNDMTYNMIFCGLNCSYSQQAQNDMDNEDVVVPGNAYELDEVHCEKVEHQKLFEQTKGK